MIACKHYVVFAVLLLLSLTSFANVICCWNPEFSQPEWVTCKSSNALPSACQQLINGSNSYSQGACRNDCQGGIAQNC